MNTQKDEQKKPLDMTTEEAMNFLFPKEVVEKLKKVAKESQKKPNPNDDNDLDDESDSAYKYNNK